MAGGAALPGAQQAGTSPRTAPGAELDGLKDAAVAAYGRDEARNLIATLGPPDTDEG